MCFLATQLPFLGLFFHSLVTEYAPFLGPFFIFLWPSSLSWSFVQLFICISYFFISLQHVHAFSQYLNAFHYIFGQPPEGGSVFLNLRNGKRGSRFFAARFLRGGRGVYVYKAMLSGLAE